MTELPWWAGHEDATATVRCGGEDHVVRWSAGALDLEAHGPADRELSLVALGAPPNACTALAQAWRDVGARDELLVLARRHDAEELDVSAVDQRRSALRRVLELPASMVDRLVLEVLERFRGSTTPIIEAALYGRLRPVAAAWTGRPHRPRLQILPPGSAPSARLAEDGVVEAALPASWLADVWARRVGVVDGGLALTVDAVAPQSGTAARPDGSLFRW